MCGFAGEIRFDQRPANVELVARMAGTLAPRGPDAEGLFQQGRYAAAHRRLKIIDLSEQAQQPMVDRDLGITLVFNGCIYNYEALRDELERMGYRFASTGDTEVILKAFHAWGDDCVKRFHGMFAFAAYERDSGVLTLARDRFGIKPLYTARVDGALRFASTLPALLECKDIDRSLNLDALNHYMSWHAVVPPPHTIVRGVQKLAPATIVKIDKDGEAKTRTWWTLDVAADPAISAMDPREREDMVEKALRLAVERRMVADVPVGVLLSGGVDSSLIVALLADMGQKGLQTFSIGFDAAGGESGDEFKYSDLVAARYGTDHHQIHIPTSELMDALPGTIRAQSEPMVSYDNVAFYLLSREVAKHTKVVQSGQGADEVFAGYHWYPKVHEAGDADAVATYRAAFFDRTPQEMAQILKPSMLSGDASQAFLQKHFDGLARSRAVEKALHLDTTVMLVDDPVKRVDNMTMAWGLEARVPFLDHELVELAGKLPIEDKLGGDGKAVLKSIARRVLPREIIDRPKGYFPVPILKYIDGPVLEMIKDTMASQAARERGVFREDAVATLLAEPSAHITPLRGSKLWQVALLELWLQGHGL